MGQWYVRTGEEDPVGPVTTEQVVKGVAAGKVPVHASICPVGGSEWQPLAAFAEFTEAVRQAAPPPPPAPPPAAPRAAPPAAAAVVVAAQPAHVAPAPAALRCRHCGQVNPPGAARCVCGAAVTATEPAMQPVVVTPPSGTPPLGFASLVFVSGAALFAVHLLVFGGTGAASLALLLMASIGAALLVLVHPRFENRTVAQMLAAFWSNLPVRISALTVVGLAELYAVFVGGRGLLRERALDAQLAATDPCAAVAAPLQDWATKKQRDTHAVRTGECDRQLAEQKTAEQHRKCAEAMVHLEARKVTPEDHVVLGSFAEVAQRVASRKLEAKDLEYISQAHMPCREHPDIVARAWAAYVAAAQESPAWGSVESANGVQGRLRDSLKSAHISAPNAEVLAKTVVQKSLTATQTGTKTADLRPARELCQLQNDVAGAESDECALLEGKYQTLLKAEEAKAEQERKIAEAKAEQERKIAEAKEKAEQAAAEAKERQEQAIEDAKTARFRACTEQCDRLPEGPAYDACSDRCLGFDRPLF